MAASQKKTLLHCGMLAIVFVAASAEWSPAHAAENSPADVARNILDDTREAREREALIEQHLHQAAEIVAAMASDLPEDEGEEYRRIPWIWRVSIAAARKNDNRTLLKLLDVSLPQAENELRDWQAVVIGGGLINGVSQLGVWPKQRFELLLDGHPLLKQRWQRALELSLAMADDPHVRSGTRYDALRMLALLDWPRPDAHLRRYVAKGAEGELQMGAVSGYVDVDQPAATKALIAGLQYFPDHHRQLALDGLLRSESRIVALLEAIQAGHVDASWLGDQRVAALQRHDSPKVRQLARRVLDCGIH